VWIEGLSWLVLCVFVLRTSDKECVTTNGLGLYLVVCSDFTKQLLCHIRSTRDSLTYNSISSTAVPLQLIARDTRKLCMPFFLGIENPGMERKRVAELMRVLRVALK
jgi:hypothetical protein